MSAHKVIFLDRDGVINVDHGYVYEIAKWNFTDRAPEALKKFQSAGYKLAVVTGQSGIARGYYEVADMERLHEYMVELLSADNVQINAIAFCPHGPDDGCACRKPKTGMRDNIAGQLGEIDYANSWMIGDKLDDVGMGKNMGTKTALVRSRYWEDSDLSDKNRPDQVVDSLFELSEKVVGEVARAEIPLKPPFVKGGLTA